MKPAKRSDTSGTHFRKILVAYDGSTDSNKALETAIALGEKLRSRVLVLVLAPVSGAADLRDAGTNVPGVMERCERRLDELTRVLDARNLWVESEMIMGPEELPERARHEGVDLMILGHRQTELLNTAPCPVMFAA